MSAICEIMNINAGFRIFVYFKKNIRTHYVLFLIYINDLPQNIISTCKMFADDTSLFSHVFNKYKSQSELNNNLKVSSWAFQWKMQFNPDPNKQAQEVNFSKQ